MTTRNPRKIWQKGAGKGQLEPGHGGTTKWAQVSSVESITKLSPSIIDNRQSTVILRRLNRADCRYRPCSPVGEIEPTIDIDRGKPTGRLIGGIVSIFVYVLGPFLTTCGTIDFFVDDCLGPLFTIVETIDHWSFFVFLQICRSISTVDQFFFDGRYRPSTNVFLYESTWMVDINWFFSESDTINWTDHWYQP